MARSDSRANGSNRCEATAASGERCRKAAIRGRYCLTHSGAQDMRELGRRGGLARPKTELRKAAALDDGLREQARDVLSRALAGEDVPKAALDSARSLFSYRADAPPTSEQARERQGAGKPVVLADLVAVAVECGMVEAEGGAAIIVEGKRIERSDPYPVPRKSTPASSTGNPQARATNSA